MLNYDDYIVALNISQLKDSRNFFTGLVMNLTEVLLNNSLSSVTTVKSTASHLEDSVLLWRTTSILITMLSLTSCILAEPLCCTLLTKVPAFKQVGGCRTSVLSTHRMSCAHAGLTLIWDHCDEPGFSLRPGRPTSRDAWRSAVYISSRALFTPSLLSLVFFIIPRCISEL
jgi:hypothetical protein